MGLVYNSSVNGWNLEVFLQTSFSCHNTLMDLSAFLEEFKAEAEENLERLDQGLLALERDPSDANLVRGLFLNAHTIKGGAGMLELKVMKQITHSLEDVLGRLRDGGEVLEANTASLLLRAVDTLRQIVRTEPTLEHPSAEMLELLSALRSRATGVIPSVPAIKTPPNLEPQKLALLLEPSQTAQLVQRQQLEQAGFNVEVFSNLDLALERLGDGGVQLVVTTLEPGGVDGLELIAEMRAANLKTPAIITMLEPNLETQNKAAKLNSSVLRKASIFDTLLTETAQAMV
jgi:chemotaxis protein histidine kinase CheA